MIHYEKRSFVCDVFLEPIMTTIRDHLRRLDASHYRGHAVIHWSMTMDERREGWLNGLFYYRFRELLTHTAFRYGVASPVFCLMPDHIHLLWMGLFGNSNQLLAMKHLRKSANESLRRIGFKLQDQAYDHLLREDEKQERAFREVCEYIARNPERAGLVKQDGFREYPFTGCLVPGYPQLRPFEPTFWDEFDRIISFIRKNGLSRLPSP
jgi:REP element-mobilizing transposase RayT